MKIIVKTILALLTRLTLKRYHPKIVGITGSIGKTSTKDAVALVLGSKYSVRKSWGNYNNEIGLPLSVLKAKHPGKNPLNWLALIIRSFFKLFGDYPEVLVLEMGADRPGDIAYLNSLVKKLDAAVITDIGMSHMEFYPSQQVLVREKFSICRAVAQLGTVALNFDSEKVFRNKHMARATVIGFGFHDQAQLKATDFHLIDNNGVLGVNFKVHYKGTVVPFFLPNVVGRPAAYAALAASAVGLIFGVNLVDASEALANYAAPVGRLRIIPGIKHTIIIDDTYNAAPDSTIAALEALQSVGKQRRLLALGSMTELGKEEEEGIKKVAAKIMEAGLNMVFLVGHQADLLEEQLAIRKFSGKILKFKTSDDARISVQNELVPSDTILLKGSQAARMERIVKEIMAEPLKAEYLLVRQSENWLDKS